MSDPSKKTREQKSLPGKRPYQKPDYDSSEAFERQALSCGASINFSPIQGCALKS